MKTLQEDIDDLDRMVDTGATKDAIRSQIRLIAREVGALQADYTSLEQHHSQFRESAEKTITQLDTKLAEKHARDKKLMDEWLIQKSRDHQKIVQSNRLRYDV